MELNPVIVVISLPVLPPPEPEADFVTDIGEIQTAPPKFTIPPEMVPIVIPF